MPCPPAPCPPAPCPPAPCPPATDGPARRRAARLVRRLAQAPPDDRLAALAADEGVSASHLQRAFRDLVGLSPKRFAMFARVCRARGLLRAARSVLDVALELGLSGPGRLHDQFVAIEAVSPGEWRSCGEGLTIGYGGGDTPLGAATVAWTPRGVCRLRFAAGRGDPLRALRREWPRAAFARDDERAAALLAQAFAGAAPDAPLRLCVRGSSFQVAVWRALIAIPPGRVASYAEIARQVGRPAAMRAVGTAVGANPIALLIPCHRVIRASGLLGGYRWGLRRKAALLAAELARSDGR